MNSIANLEKVGEKGKKGLREMKAKDIMTYRPMADRPGERLWKRDAASVPADMPLSEVLPRLLDSPGREVRVEDAGRTVGVIDGDRMLEGLGAMIAGRDDVSVVTVECAPADYSASELARAVEDTDTHLVDLWTRPVEGGKILATLRVRRNDPSPVVHSLERYGYAVTDAYGESYRDMETAATRLLELQTLLGI